MPTTVSLFADSMSWAALLGWILVHPLFVGLLSAAVAGIIAWLIEKTKSTRERNRVRAREEELNRKVGGLTERNAHLQEAAAARLDELRESQELVAALQRQNGDIGSARSAIEEAHQSLYNRIEDAASTDGQLWSGRVRGTEVPFVQLSDDAAARRMAIVSVLNLKGGVGKTTLTAHLGAALASRGFRVLLVDLDLQGSLSTILLNAEALRAADSGLGRDRDGRLLPDFFRAAVRSEPVSLTDFLLPIYERVPSAAGCAVVPTTDRLV